MALRKLLAGLLVCASFATIADAAPTTIVGPDGLYGAAVDSTGALKITGSLSSTQAAFAPTGNAVTLAVTTTTSNVTFGSGATTVAVSNTGANTAYIAFGTTSGVTATTSGYPILAGQTVFLSQGANTYIAGITSASTTSLIVTPGTGVPAITGGGSSGGAVTIASGAVVSGAYVSGSIADLGPYNTANTVAYFLSQIAAGTAASSTLPVYGAVTTAVPSYSNATNNAVSLDTTGAQRITPIGSATGGATAYHLAGGTTATTNSTLISTGAHTVYSISAINTTSTIYYLRIYDSAAAPTCSSATGALMTIPVPNAAAAGAGVAYGFGATGFLVSSGFGFCVTGGGADTDNTSAATGVYINATYK